LIERFPTNEHFSETQLMSQYDLSLDQLEADTAATIIEILGDDVLSCRLMEMGLIEGEEIIMVGKAPMGDPTEYSIRGYRLSLRKNESARVIVRRDSQSRVSE
jgi:ferrous iron transport protein A